MKNNFSQWGIWLYQTEFSRYRAFIRISMTTRRLGMKTRLDEVFYINFIHLPWIDHQCYYHSCSLLWFQTFFYASITQQIRQYHKFFNDKSHCTRPYCLYEKQRWRLAWVTWHIVIHGVESGRVRCVLGD